MPLEQQLRDQLSEATLDVVGGPDLNASITSGRRKRRIRALALSSGGAVAVIGASFTIVNVVSGPAEAPVARDSVVAMDEPTGYPDYVAGTDIDTMLQAVVAEHVPSVGDPVDVFPSDWNHNGPMPDARWAEATDWEAVYNVGPGEQLTVLMGFPRPDEPAYTGTGVDHDSFPVGNYFAFTTSTRGPDGMVINAIDKVVADSREEAVAQRATSQADLNALVVDPRLTFPAPAEWPVID